MSTAMLERVEAPVVVEEGPDLDHIVCHCDLKHGWCGVEIGFTIQTADAESTCPDCEALVLKTASTGVCPHGCSCTPAMRMLYCGVDPVDDEEDEDE